MLNKETFTKGITIIQKMFLNWSFNSKDPLQMQLWYEALQGIEDDKFMDVIKTYCTTRIHAPNCPNDLLMILADDEEKKWPNPNQAFERVRELIRTWGWLWGRQDIYEAIKDNPALVKTVKEMETELRELTSDDTFTPERFRKAYAINLKTMCMRKRDEQLRLTVAAGTQSIESPDLGRALPYET